jgi:hypothetical protein
MGAKVFVNDLPVAARAHEDEGALLIDRDGLALNRGREVAIERDGGATAGLCEPAAHV